MIKWMNQLIIRNKCHWIQNSWVTVKEGAIILANPIKSIIGLFSHIFFSHINSLVFPTPPFLALWLMNMQCEIQIIAPSMFIWIIAPLHNQINLLSVFVWMFSHVHGITYSNKCSCVYYDVWGSRYTHACLCVYLGPYSPWMALTCLGAKAWLTIFQFKYMETYYWAISSNLWLRLLSLRLTSLER